MPNILIIEDNQKLSELIDKFLKRKEMDSHIVSDGISAVRSFVGASYDLLLIDIELPMMNGDEVCRKIRESAKGRNIPIIMMSMSEKDPSEIERLTRELTLKRFSGQTVLFRYAVRYDLIGIAGPDTGARCARAHRNRPCRQRSTPCPLKRRCSLFLKKMGPAS